MFSSLEDTSGFHVLSDLLGPPSQDLWIASALPPSAGHTGLEAMASDWLCSAGQFTSHLWASVSPFVKTELGKLEGQGPFQSHKCHPTFTFFF